MQKTYFFRNQNNVFYAIQTTVSLSVGDIRRLSWLLGGAECLDSDFVTGVFTGPRKEMVTPWSTNAVEITQNMGIRGITRIEELKPAESGARYDRMLETIYENPGQDLFFTGITPEPVIFVDNIAAYNEKEGLALSPEEIGYLNRLSEKLRQQSGRTLTDSEIFGFSQVNSEHCRHKIFNGKFIIDGQEMPFSLFELIKKTSRTYPNLIVSAYKDNVAFIEGPAAEQFAPIRQDIPGYFSVKDIQTVLALKAETHNFPTTVEPFNGAATGTGGEIRDRMAGGKGSIPLAGTAVYMTAYPRITGDRSWEQKTQPRNWLYQTPEEILIKASNGASDFGNKFGQPLICGSVLTFEHFTETKKYGYDKVIMLAGGIGFGKVSDSFKDKPSVSDRIIVMGGDNYRIGMGGGAVSSVATGEYKNHIELNAVQRSNPEMQKRIYNVTRALAESEENPVISIHDHGAGGHLNCLSELVEESGGKIDIGKLPVGDSTLSSREIIGNESQERMGLLLREKDTDLLVRIAERERAPVYIAGEVTGDHKLVFEQKDGRPVDLELRDMFGNPPVTVLEDVTVAESFGEIEYDRTRFEEYLRDVLQLEAVACKDWLTNKVDRSVTGRIAHQQTTGPLQLPLNNLGVAALDYQGIKGIATSIGHAPVSGLIDPEAGSTLSVAEALTNLLWAPLEGGLSGVSLSANWMWPARNPGENTRLYLAVKAVSDFAIRLGINIPTGKDSLSMTQKYPGDMVYSPGTVIISTVAGVTDIRKIISPVLRDIPGSELIYIDFSSDRPCLGGSSFSQVAGTPGTRAPKVTDPEYFRNAFNCVQQMILEEMILAGHDISAGGLITTLLEMTFSGTGNGLEIRLDSLGEPDSVRLLFSENPGIIIQVKDKERTGSYLEHNHIRYHMIGTVNRSHELTVINFNENFNLDIPAYRDTWYRTSYLLDRKQSGETEAAKRFENYKKQPLQYRFSSGFTGRAGQFGIDLQRRENSGIKAAIIREKGVNGDREMAWSLYMAGFDVKDVHMTDLISGRETLDDIRMIVFVGGFSNSDVLGSAKGWAGAFMYNEKAKNALERFYHREDTVSLGVCNGCQLMVWLGLITPEPALNPKMLRNASNKFESAFLNVDISDNRSIMLKSLAGSRLGIWVAHGEGRFSFPTGDPSHYHIPMYYSYPEYPGNPNGSDFAAAAICSADGRHLAMMPHIERAMLPWQWAWYPEDRKQDEISPWTEAFVNAREWIKNKTEK